MTDSQSPLLVLRRDLPGGAIVMVALERQHDGSVRGELRLERRRDDTRRRGHIPPLIAEVHAPTQQEAMAALRRVAEDDEELRARLDLWRHDRDDPR